MVAASCELVVMRDVPVSMMAPSAFMYGTMVLPTATPSNDTIQYLQSCAHWVQLFFQACGSCSAIMSISDTI